MSVEERLRGATRARADLVRDIRPLELPDELPARGGRFRLPRGGHRSRRWLSWGAPLAAAAVVALVATLLVVLRQAPETGPVSPASPSTSPFAAAIPRYYVALAGAGGAPARMKAVVGDDQTGRTVAQLIPSASQNFYGVTGAADDRTFVVTNYTAATEQTTWYLLRLNPGAAQPTQLTELPIKPVAAHVAGLALSPDGRELAVMWRSATTQVNAVTYLAVYSMATGAALHTWITRGDNYNAIAGGANGEGLSWVGGERSIDFRWTVANSGANGGFTNTVRRIDVAAAGADLLASSRVAVKLPPTTTPVKSAFSEPCDTSITAANGTVVCGTTTYSAVSYKEVCSTLPPSFVTYSGTTGKQTGVLYRYHGQCLAAGVMPVWADPTASHVIAFLLRSVKGVKVSATDDFGLVTAGHFTLLPKLVVGLGDAADAGGLAF